MFFYSQVIVSVVVLLPPNSYVCAFDSLRNIITTKIFLENIYTSDFKFKAHIFKIAKHYKFIMLSGVPVEIESSAEKWIFAQKTLYKSTL
jgi:hypothetical protein